MLLMKYFSLLSIVGVLLATSLEARDLTYKIGAGYAQMYTNSLRDKKTNTVSDAQIHGLQASMGIARDMHIGAFFGFKPNFGAMLIGPSFRYDFQRLISRDNAIWEHVNLFGQVAFLAKLGGDYKRGITIHAPTLGVEILPFSNNNLAFHSSAGCVIDLVDKSKIGFTQGLLGDLGVKYYF